MPLVVSNALCKCSFGAAPSPLEVLPLSMVMGCGLPAATITDAIPLVNIMPFGTCSSIANPVVAAATAAAMGALTPMPCIPVTEAWAPGSPTITLKDIPALNNSSIAMCAFGGVITITFPGQVTVEVP